MQQTAYARWNRQIPFNSVGIYFAILGSLQVFDQHVRVALRFCRKMIEEYLRELSLGLRGSIE